MNVSGSILMDDDFRIGQRVVYTGPPDGIVRPGILGEITNKYLVGGSMAWTVKWDGFISYTVWQKHLEMERQSPLQAKVREYIVRELANV